MIQLIEDLQKGMIERNPDRSFQSFNPTTYEHQYFLNISVLLNCYKIYGERRPVAALIIARYFSQ